MAAALICQTVCFPIDLIKSKMQACQSNYKNARHCVQETVRNGVKGLYRGFSVAAARNITSSVVGQLVFENARKFLGHENGFY